MCKAKDFNLTDKQFAFCLDYVKTMNATKSYQEVYKVDYETANKIASRLMVKDGVRACIDKLFSEITFDKQAIINQCIAIKIQLANGLITQKRIDRSTGKVIEFSPTQRDMNDATNDLLKLFGAYETTSSTDEDNEMEDLKQNIEEAKDIEVKGFDDESK